MSLWYFAHPYSAKDKEGKDVLEAEDANFQLANQRSAELFKRGYNIYSPISHTHPIHRVCPEFLKNKEHSMWDNLNKEMIEITEFKGIILAPKWEISKRCVSGRYLFLEKGLQIKLYEDILKEKEIYL